MIHFRPKDEPNNSCRTMPSSVLYDVLIAGGGPAGALLAYLLASRGIRVLVLEKKAVPRYKACGGGLTAKALKLLPFDIGTVIEDETRSATVFVHGQEVFSRTSPEPFISMLMRDRFDSFLLSKAREAGAHLLDNTAFQSVYNGSEILNIDTNRGRYRSLLLVGADGVFSSVARATGLAVSKKRLLALESEITPGAKGPIDNLRQCAHFDFGVVPGGYGWIFPKAHHLSVGLASRNRSGTNLKAALAAYLQDKGFAEGARWMVLRGHAIPYGVPRSAGFANRYCLLAGDAAGITDPVTGEGIYYALRQAHIALPVIVNSVEEGKPLLEEYNRLMNDAFLRELSSAEKMAAVLYGLPGLSYRALQKRGQALGGYLIDVLSGKSSYQQLYQNKMPFFTKISSLLARNPAR